MAWAKVDDGWWCHPKVMGLSVAARGLWVSALSWSCAQRRDVVPEQFLMMVGASNIEAKELEEAGLWIAEADAWRIHDWAEYQDRSLSEKRADAGRKGGKASGVTRRAQASQAADRSNGEATDEAGTHPGPTQPKREPTPASPSLELVSPPGPSAPAEDGFDAWWSEYPRKQDKAEARKAYRKALTTGPRGSRPTPEALLDGLRRSRSVWARECRPIDKHPYGATWLNKRRWEDEAIADSGDHALNEMGQPER